MTEWLSMAQAPRTGEVLLLLGETIPDHMDVRAGSFVPGNEADEMGYREYAKYGCWMIWNDASDWFCIDGSEPLGWLPLPTTLPRRPQVIDAF